MVLFGYPKEATISGFLRPAPHFRHYGPLQRRGCEAPVSVLGRYSGGFTLDTYTHITSDMQRGAAEEIGGFMETATAKPEPEPPDPPEESRCKVIPFERVG